MSTMPTLDADDIRRQMALIRRDLHENVKEVVATATAVTDWKYYLTMFPLASLGAAFVIGYLVVPQRRVAEVIEPPSTFAKIKGMARNLQSKAFQPGEVVEPVKKKPGLAKSLFSAAMGMVTPLIIRTVQGYAVQYAEQWIAQQQERQMRMPPTSPHSNPSTAARG